MNKEENTRPAPQASEAVAYIVTDPDGKPDLMLATDWDPTDESFWVEFGGLVPPDYTVTPLYTAPQGVRDAWVSVKNGLPECGGKYWCVVRFKARYNGAICTRPAHRKYRALDFDVEKQGFWLDNGMPQEMITHWMKAEKMPPHESAPPAMSEGGGSEV